MNKVKIKYILILFISAVIFSVLALIVNKFIIGKKYVATTTIAVKTQSEGSSYAQLSVSHYMAETFASIYDSDDVVSYTAKALGDSFNPRSIRENVNVQRKKNTILIKIIATEKSPERAILLSKTYTEGLIEELAKPLKLKVEVVQEGDEAIKVSRNLRAVFVGGFLGLVLSSAYIFFRHIWPNRILSNDMLKSNDIPILGTTYVDKGS